MCDFCEVNTCTGKVNQHHTPHGQPSDHFFALARCPCAGNLTKVAETLQQLPRLRRLFLMRNNIGGPFDCSIITPKLEVGPLL